MRQIIAATCLAFLVTGCGGELTLTEYAEQVEGLTTTMYGTIDELTAQFASETPTVEELQTGYTAAAAAYRDLHQGLQELDPPEETVDLHNAAVDLAANLASAGEDFARRVQEIETEDQLRALFASPEGRAARAAEDNIVAFCRERQAELDATADREPLSDVPWIPREMKEVVLVAFGCDAPDSNDG
jgi:hypothetical protein